MAAVGSVLMLLKRAWLERYKWAVLAIAGAGAVGAIFAAGSGDALEEGPARGSRPAIEEHADAGEGARLFGVVFFVVVLIAVMVPVLLERRARRASAPTAAHGPRVAAPGWLRTAMAAAIVLSATASVATVIDAGHSGATSSWGDVKLDGGTDDHDDRDGDDGV